MKPSISICIPYFNRRGPLLKTIESFKTCGYFDNGSVEVVICDDGSTLQPLRKIELPSTVKKVYLPEKTEWMCACTPLNKAVASSTAPLVLLQSPETIHPMPVLRAMLDAMRHPRMVVSCPTKVVNRKMPSWTGGWYAHPQFRPVHYWWCQMMTRELFDSVGGFDERMRASRGEEDRDFYYTLVKHGVMFSWAAGVHVETYHFMKERYGKPRIRCTGNNNPNHALFVKKHGRIPPLP